VPVGAVLPDPLRIAESYLFVKRFCAPFLGLIGVGRQAGEQTGRASGQAAVACLTRPRPPPARRNSPAARMSRKEPSVTFRHGGVPVGGGGAVQTSRRRVSAWAPSEARPHERGGTP